jgi:hypothetical protein
MSAQVRSITDAIDSRLPLCIVEIASQYGNTVVRPVGIVAKTFAEIAGTKTLTRDTLAGVRKLGYRIVIESGGSGKGYDMLNRFIGQ